VFVQTSRLLVGLASATLALTIGLAAQPARPESHDAAIKRAVGFLAKEVPKWHAEHPCYSCHNNGDATRALIVAGMRGYDIGTSVDETVDFLRVPSQWDQNKAPGGFDDRTLARIQFASALAVAARAGRAPDSTLVDAAKIIAGDQQGDGSWTLDASKSLASPTTYGTLLATASARATLIASGREPDDFSVVKTDRFFRGVPVENVIDAAAVALGLDVAEDMMAENLRAKCLGIIREGQGPSGGWGPFITAPPQVFDTAIAVLALSLMETEGRLGRKVYRPEELREAVAKGRDYLVSQQRPDGSWPETTRPAGQESYAQRISTTGWALLALLR
jgi:Prenyltransferase and squalene oxidase repeat